MGGLQEVVSQLAREFTALGHETLVVTNRYPRSLPAKQVIGGVQVRRMLFTGIMLGGWALSSVMKQVIGFPISAVNLLRLVIVLQKFRPDVVNIHFLGNQAAFGWAASRLLGIPYVISLHGDDVEGIPLRSKMDRKVFQTVICDAAHVTACSNYLLNSAAGITPEVSVKGTAIWNGVNADEIANAVPYAHPGRYIFAAGRFVSKKGFDILLRAYRIALDNGFNADLVLAGIGPEEDALRKLATELGLAEVRTSGEKTEDHGVLFWGRASREEMISLLAGCVLLVVPSRDEPFGIVALEGVAARKPIVAARTGGLVELLSGRSRTLLVEPGNPIALSGAIVKLAEEIPCTASCMDDRVRTWRQVAKDYLDVCRDCLLRTVKSCGK